MAPSRPVLVTGGAGYIGSHVVRLLRRAGYPVLVYDNLSTGFAWAVGDAELIVADLVEHEGLAALFAARRFGAVLHFAARMRVEESIFDPVQCYRNNVAHAPGLFAMAARYEVAGVVRRVSGINFPVEAGPRRPGDPSALVASNRKLRAVLGWQPRHDDLEFIVSTAWRWEQRLQAVGGPDRSGAAPSAPQIAGLGAR